MGRPVANASQEVRVHTISIPGKGDTTTKTIDTLDYPNGHADAIQVQEKRETTMAGRCFRCSHIGLCGPRVMKTCGHMGTATGYAVALYERYSVRPRDVGR